MKRAALIVLSVLALPIAVVFLFGAGSYDAPCKQSVSGDITFAATGVAVVAALAALITACLPKTLRVSAWLLGTCVMALGVAILLAETCA